MRSNRPLLIFLLSLIVASAAATFAPAAHAAQAPFGNLDHARRAIDQGTKTVRVKGWAADPDAPTTPIRVQITVDGQIKAKPLANESRPDIAQAFPGYGDRHGFLRFIEVPQGTHRICVTALSIGGGPNRFLGCRDVDVRFGAFGAIDAVYRIPGGDESTVRVKGWAIDPDTADPIEIRVKVDGFVQATDVAQRRRNDVERRYPRYGPDHGFQVDVFVGPGGHEVCVSAPKVGLGSAMGIDCVPVGVGVQPFGVVKSVTAGTGPTIDVAGWTIDPDTKAAIDIEVTVDGRSLGTATADQTTGAIPGRHSRYGDDHGFDATFVATSSEDYPRLVCVYGVNVILGSGTTLLGCRSLSF